MYIDSPSETISHHSKMDGMCPTTILGAIWLLNPIISTGRYNLNCGQNHYEFALEFQNNAPLNFWSIQDWIFRRCISLEIIAVWKFKGLCLIVIHSFMAQMKKNGRKNLETHNQMSQPCLHWNDIDLVCLWKWYFF